MTDRSELVEIARRQLASGNLAGAESLCRQVLERKPRHPEANAVLGVALLQAGRPRDAEKALRIAAEGRPRDLPIRTDLARALMEQGRTGPAIDEFKEAVKARPSAPQGHFNLGVALARAGRMQDAEAAFRRCVELDGASHQAWANLGKVCRNQHKLEAAGQAYERCLALDTGNARTVYDHGEVLVAQGRIREAVDRFRRAVQMDPRCEPAAWGIASALNYARLAPPGEVRAAHVRYARMLGRPEALAPRAPRDLDPDRKLRIGYVSPDLREHSCASFFEPVLARHDRGRHEVFCYAEVKEPDDTTRRLQAPSDHWRFTVGVTDEAMARTILADGIDILVDLGGYGAGNRLRAFTWKPAPVQVTYLGYPNTTGIDRIDYRLGDALTDPPGAEAHYVEELVRLPGCFLCYGPPAPAQAVPEPPALRAGRVTFGSFNNLAKLSPETVELWARVLKLVRGSQLLLKNQSALDPPTRDRVAGWFTEAGIEPGRVKVARWTKTTAEHREMYGQVDVGLDTFPYHGTTTTCEALWMGVPVVTLVGDVHAARVGLSLLTACGLSELAAADAAAYVEKAAALAADPARLAEMRRGLRGRLLDSPLCDAAGFASKLEEAYRRMWRRHVEGPPRAHSP